MLSLKNRPKWKLTKLTRHTHSKEELCACVRVAEAHSAGDWEEEDEGRNRETHKQIGKKKKKETLRVR